MSTINEIKDQMAAAKSLGDFTNALQQIATIRMVKLRERVLSSRPFVQIANEMLTELSGIRNGMQAQDLIALEKSHPSSKPATMKTAVVVITSNQGLIGRYNIEIFQKLDKVFAEQPNSDYYVIGKKGQEYFQGKRIKVKSFPYQVGDNFHIEDLHRLVTLFDYYAQITLVYSRYLNSAKRDIVAVSIVRPEEDELELKEHPQAGRYVFEPDIFSLIDGISRKLRAALFQQQIFDARLSQNSSQMIGMKTASDNAVDMLADLRLEYNKQRRKLIDKKISEVFAGSALW